MIKNKIQYEIKFKSYDHKLLEFNLLTLIFELKKKLNFLKITKIIYSPHKIKKICVIRSPFVDNVSKEHFELRVFKISFLIEFFDPNNLFVERILENSLTNILKNQEITISYKKNKIRGL